MSAWHNGSLRTMKANYWVQQEDVRVIRPLVLVRESTCSNFARQARLPIISDNCPACFAAPKERHRIKMMLSEQELEFPKLFASLLKTLRPLLSITHANKADDFFRAGAGATTHGAHDAAGEAAGTCISGSAYHQSRYRDGNPKGPPGACVSCARLPGSQGGLGGHEVGQEACQEACEEAFEETLLACNLASRACLSHVTPGESLVASAAPAPGGAAAGKALAAPAARQPSAEERHAVWRGAEARDAARCGGLAAPEWHAKSALVGMGLGLATALAFPLALRFARR